MPRLTTLDIRQMKEKGEPIAMVTAYDATFARLIDQAGADMLLVGDSLGMVVQGHESTLPVTMEHMIYHCQAVVRGSQRAMVVGDLPFMSYQVSVERALENAGRLLAEGGCHAVKLEGGERSAAAARAMVQAGIPVVGHLGLTPQSVYALGGFKVQGKTEEAARRLIDDAKRLEDAGVFAIVLETIPVPVAEAITRSLAVPTIGIGAGVHCDGQVLVSYDMLGLFEELTPKFVKRYDDLGARTRVAVRAYVDEVKARTFPSDEFSFR
ncbi:MAG: 3-methyl-2-oxobutanoate hydroxymethyltransferase [Deltaproteobacteria bacterium HGW-Deltaproteobacteria-14]|jgi:3-methyl-2-oxobutanoate hydroxymethyltransferase|nr:MAG: 3-methyl-2-oxobutanoate hydroxymethyltransferase [Deltaproteobacteria bacterium HGW-Deltaproteobacteria-14]